MTENELQTWQQTLVTKHILDILPTTFHKATKVNFHRGSVCRLVAERVRSKLQLDPVCKPKNTFEYSDPMIGDSVGLALNQGDDHSTSTLGSCLLIGETPYWLMTFHSIEDAVTLGQTPLHNLIVEHPSPDDRNFCLSAGHKVLAEPQEGFKVGTIAAISGPDTSTTRTSRNPYWKLAGFEPPQVIMDWALCTAKRPQVNTVRIPESRGHNAQTICSTLSLNEESCGAPIYSIGRTSGLCRGQIGLCPDLVSTKVTGARTETREWFVEEPFPYDDERGWVESGIGVSGDSGAAILDQESHSLYGHLWGRNEDKVGRSAPRVTYFTPIDDLFDDIEEKISGIMRPRLPQPSEAFTPPLSAPACPQCRLQDYAWQEEKTLQPDAESPGIDITREERHNYDRMTPMRDMILSIEMTPQEEDVLTPEDIRSPDVQRERRLLFQHTGLSCQLPFDKTQEWQTRITDFSTVGTSNAEATGFLPYGELDVESDEYECLSNDLRLARKRAGITEEDANKILRSKRQRVG